MVQNYTLTNHQESHDNFGLRQSHIDHCLDITEDTCPMTFVKTRILLDQMSSGEMCLIRLKGSSPLKNVPSAAQEVGCKVISLTHEGSSHDNTVWTLILRK